MSYLRKKLFFILKNIRIRNKDSKRDLSLSSLTMHFGLESKTFGSEGFIDFHPQWMCQTIYSTYILKSLGDIISLIIVNEQPIPIHTKTVSFHYSHFISFLTMPCAINRNVAFSCRKYNPSLKRKKIQEMGSKIQFYVTLFLMSSKYSPFPFPLQSSQRGSVSEPSHNMPSEKII